MICIEGLFQTTLLVIVTHSYTSAHLSFVIKQKNMKFPIEKDNNKDNDSHFLFPLHL